MTQMGPAWLRFSFAPNCTFTARVQLLFARFTESGRYAAVDSVVTFERRSGTTRWPYRIAAGRLVLQEAATERYAYRRR